MDEVIHLTIGPLFLFIAFYMLYPTLPLFILETLRPLEQGREPRMIGSSRG